MGREPQDLDVVTLFVAPPSLRNPAEMELAKLAHPDILQRNRVKARYHCDALWVGLHLDGATIADHVRYYVGLFSHRRNTLEWKGMLSVPLDSSIDSAARTFLDQVKP